MTVRIAGIQMACSADRDANLERAADLAGYAAEKGAELIAFQELFSLPWFPREANPEHNALAEDLEGPTITRMREVARSLGVVLACPFFEKEGCSQYNTTAVIEADGRVLGTYRKTHVPQLPLWEERFYFQSGNTGFPVFDTSCGRIGIQMSWDVFFPEGTRILALKGAELVLAPTSAAFASQARWEKMICANAIANNIFIFRVNRVGKEEKQTFYGKTFCVDPHGEFVAEPAGSGDAVVFAAVNFDEVRECRETWTFLRDRRPEAYGEIATP